MTAGRSTGGGVAATERYGAALGEVVLQAPSPPRAAEKVLSRKLRGMKRAGAVRPRPSLLSREDVAEKPSLAEDFTENLLGCAPHSVGDLLHTVVHGFCHATEDWVDDVVGDGIHDLAYTVGSGTYDFSSPF